MFKYNSNSLRFASSIKIQNKLFQCLLKYVQPGTVAYAAGWGAIITDEKLGPLGFLVPKEQKRPKVLQVKQEKRIK